MDVQIDRTKVYTTGEWVRGTILLQSKMHDVKEICVELQGILSQSSPNKPMIYKDTRFYTLKEKIAAKDLNELSSEGCGQSFQFAIQFPEHGSSDFVKLPATTVHLNYTRQMEIRYLVTVIVVRWGTLARKLQRTVEIEFMPSECLSLILEPDVVYHEQFGDMQFSVRISMPRFFVQEDAPNIIAIKILQPKLARYKLHSVKAKLLGFRALKGKGDMFLNIPVRNKLLSKKFVEVSIASDCNESPAFSLSGVSLRWQLRLDVTVTEIHTQSHHTSDFVKTIDILPTLLYKSHQQDFALPDEIIATSRLRYRGIPNSTPPLPVAHADTSTSFEGSGHTQGPDESSLPAYVETPGLGAR